MLELPTGRLAKVNPGDVVAGVLGRRRALKGFVGDVPETVKAGDELHLLNLGGVIGQCSGHHSSLNDAIKVEVLGLAANGGGSIQNIAELAAGGDTLGPTAPLVVIAGACMKEARRMRHEIITDACRAANRRRKRMEWLVSAGHAEHADHGAMATATSRWGSVHCRRGDWRRSQAISAR